MLRSHRTEQLGEKSYSVPRQQRAHQMPERWGWTVGQEKIRCQGSKQHDGCGPKIGIFLHDATLRDSEETRSNILDETRRGAAMCLWMFTNACALTYKHRIHFIQTTDAANWSTKALISISCQICDKRELTRDHTGGIFVVVLVVLFFTIYMKQRVKKLRHQLRLAFTNFQAISKSQFSKVRTQWFVWTCLAHVGKQEKMSFLGAREKIPQWWNWGGARLFFWWQRSRERLDRLVLSFVFESYLLCSKVDSHCKILLQLN